MPKEQYIITINRPDDATVTDVKDYIRDAVSTWGGCYHPEDPLFGYHTVIVKKYK